MTMRPGKTKAFTMTANAWVRVATLYDPVNTPLVKEGTAVAQGGLVSVTTFAMQICWDSETPTSAGHPMAAGDSFEGSQREWLSNMWVKNDAAGSNGVIIVTPFYTT